MCDPEQERHGIGNVHRSTGGGMKLSVLLITYNHEKFIAQALDSILMQKVDFDYEIVIGEDCSTDKTRKIIRDYLDRYPDKIRFVARERNIGPIKNFIQTYKSCTGKYIAMIDGDDYWTSPDKLQKQVDFLEKNDDFAIVFHMVGTVDELDGAREGRTWPDHPKDVYTIEDLLKECFMHTAATVCRNGLFGEFPEWFHSTIMYDWPTHVLNAQYGKIKCIREILGIYRFHGGGLWSGLEKPATHLEYIKFYKAINTHLKKRYEGIIKTRLDYHYCTLALMYYELALENEESGNIGNARTYALKSIICNPTNKENKEASKYFKELPSNKDRLKLFSRVYFPWGYGMLKNIKLLVSKHS